MIYRPDYVEAVRPFIDQPLVKILAGVRRSGKSTIFEMIREELKQRGVGDDRIILKKYTEDLRQSAVQTGNEVDVRHCEFLSQIMELLEHNDFLTAQSQKIREFYKYMAREYPYLSFTFKGRIKSLIRAESKFNGYVVEYIYDYYTKNGTYPPVSELQERLNCWLKKRRQKVCNHFLMVSSSYIPLNVRAARKNILEGRKPQRRK